MSHGSRSWSGLSTPPSRYARLLLLLWWFSAAIFILVVFQRNAGSVIPVTEIGDLTVQQNGIGTFSMGRLKSDSDRRPAFHISGSNLHAANARHGIFNTPMSKTITIDDLQVKIHSIAGQQKLRKQKDTVADAWPTSLSWGPGLQSSSGTSRKTLPRVNSLGGFYRYLEHQVLGEVNSSGIRVSLPVDTSNATSVIIRNLSYDLYHDEKLELGVKCRKAVFSGTTSEIVLRGCVVIRGQNGAELVSNGVRWDLEQNHFTVPGSYLLHRNGVLRRGRGVCCDDRLRIVREHHVSSEEGEGAWARRLFR